MEWNGMAKGECRMKRRQTQRVISKSLPLLSRDTGRYPTMGPTAGGELEIGVRTQEHIPLLLLESLFPPPGHAEVGLAAPLGGRCFGSGSPVRVDAPLADGCHDAMIARRAHLPVL